MERVKKEVGAENYSKGRFKEAIDIFRKMSTSPQFETFLTLPAYKKIA
jgi:malate synthase